MSQLENEMDASAGSVALTGAAPAQVPSYYSQLLKSIGNAEPITADATYMGPASKLRMIAFCMRLRTARTCRRNR